ncbi:MAG: hypothetical protein HQK66_07795 [Desulfamplus sp.]|nr:hypothetical protein [Desulfamplus sp.]
MDNALQQMGNALQQMGNALQQMDNALQQRDNALQQIGNIIISTKDCRGGYHTRPFLWADMESAPYGLDQTMIKTFKDFSGSL